MYSRALSAGSCAQRSPGAASTSAPAPCNFGLLPFGPGALEGKPRCGCASFGLMLNGRVRALRSGDFRDRGGRVLLPHVNTLLGSGRRRRRSSGAHAKDGDDVEIDRWSTSPAMAPQDSAGEPQSSGPVASHPSQGDLGRAGAHGAGEEEEREGVSKKTRPLYRIIEMLRQEMDGDVLMRRLSADMVPWNLFTVGKVLMAWLVGFTAIGWYVIPGALAITGQDRFSMTMRAQALMHLFLDVWQCAMTLLILWVTLRRHRPLKLGMFPMSFRPRTWLPYVLVGIASFPLVEALAAVGARVFPEESDTWAQGLGETLLSCDPVTAGAYFIVVSVCAPLWEEVMFRGFLMPSFAKYFRVPGAALASALLFSMAHFSLSRSLPLVLLGIVIGLLFAASRNLTTAVVLHAAWNFWVLITIGTRVGLS